MPARADRLIHYVRRIASPPADPSADVVLLNRFVNDRDGVAFEALVTRHGPMVFRVCHRLLADAQDAEDAFQATFLVLAKKAASVRPAGALPAWLHGVARRIALGASTARAHRRLRETSTSDLASLDPHPDPLTELTAREALRILDEEVQRLPAMYRLPVVLCCLEGLSQEEAARQLAWTPGSVKGRLERGRKRLHRRLVGRGLELAAALSLLEIARASAAGPSATLLASTAKAGMAFVAGNNNISREVARLAERGLRQLTFTKVKAGLLVLLAVGVTVAGAGTLAHQVLAGRQPATRAGGKAEDVAAEKPKPRETKQAPTDRHGDPLPEGVLARLGTVRLRAIGAEVRFSPDGKSILTIIGGRRVKLWDADTGQLREQRELPIEDSRLTCLSPDGGTLAIQGVNFDAPLDIWDVSSGKRRHRLKMPEGQGIYRAAFSPDGKTLAVAEYGLKRIVRLWDMESGEQRLLNEQAQTPEGLTFSPDGKRLATAGHSHITCWNLAGGEQLWQVRSPYGRRLAFTPDGRTLIASPGTQERSWHVWDAATGKPAGGLKLPEGYNYAQLAVAPDGRTLVFAQQQNILGADCRVRLWDLHTGKLLHTLTAEGGIGPFSKDGKSFLTNDGALQRWDLATGRPLLPDTNEWGHRAEVGRAAYSPDGRLLASTARDGTLRLWEVATGKPLHVLRGSIWEMNGLAFTPDGKFLVSAGMEGNSFEGKWFVWDAITGKEVRRVPLHDPKLGEKKQSVWRVHVTSDGRTVIVLGYCMDVADADTEGVLTTWDLATGRRKSRATYKGHDGFYTAFSPDGRTLASNGRLLDTSTGKERAKLENPPGYLGHYAFSPDGRLARIAHRVYVN